MVNLKLKFPQSFFEEEVRSGYTVTREMKKIWAVELDMLAEFDRVCKKHNIIYFASGGTMLGAVRHRGFIPWDDDIDLMMRRDQYNKLCSIASEEFHHPYFFQTEYSDTGSLRGHAQLRNSETTGILKGEANAHKQINQGIFLDIFPLDNVVDDEALFVKQERKALRYRRICHHIASFSINYVPSKNRVKAMIKYLIHCMLPRKYSIRLMDKYYKKFEEECQRYNDRETKRFSSLSFQFSNRQHIKYCADYAELIDMPFEFLSIPVGKGYEHALDVRYGEWRKPVIGTSCHGGVIFDTEKPYTEYIRK